MKSFLIACFCLVVAAAFGFQRSSPKKEPAGLTVQGTVVEDSNAQPVSKANVQLIGGGEQRAARQSAMTDAEGRFAIEGVTAGRYLVMIDHPGLVQTASGRRPITVLRSTSDLVFHMQPAAVIAGKITDQDGDPIQNVGVTATRVGSARGFRQHESGNASTNDLGEFRIADLEPGGYTVVASPPREMQAPSPAEKGNTHGRFVYVTTYYPGTLDKDQSIPVAAQAGSETPVNMSVLTSKAFSVAGKLVGLPTGQIGQIILTSTHGVDSEQELREGGKFEFPSVLPGTYRVQVILLTGLGEGTQPGMQVMRVNEPVEVSQADIEGLQLHADPGGKVRGRFRTDDNKKVDWTRLTVMLLENSGNGASIEVSNGFARPTFSSVKPDGTFEMKNVPGGHYQLLVGARGSAENLRDYFTKSVILDGSDVSDSGFQITPETFLEVVISAKGATIEGTVVDDKGNPVPYATVFDVPSPEHRSRPDLYHQDTSDEHGHFSLRGLNPGPYTVFAFEDLQGSPRDPEFLRSYAGRGQRVDLDEGSHKSVVLKLVPAGDA